MSLRISQLRQKFELERNISLPRGVEELLDGHCSLDVSELGDLSEIEGARILPRIALHLNTFYCLI